jgi:PPOX class probable F420-dependent enzyme
MALPSAAGPDGPDPAPAAEGDLARFLDGHHRAFLVTLRPDGGPTAHPMGLIPRDGRIYFNTYRKSAKVRNIERDPRACCLAASPDDDPDFAAVAVSGRAGVVPAEAVPESLLTGGSSSAMGAEDLERVRARLRTGKRVYLEVHPDSVRFCEPLAPRVPAYGGTWEGLAGSMGSGAIAMTPAEAAAYVGSRDVAALATIDAAGAPRVIAVRYTRLAGALVALVPRSAPSADDVAGDPRVCVSVEEFPTYDTIRGVMIHGRAEPVAGGPAAEGMPEGFVPVRVVASHVVSFDFRKIVAQPAPAP